MNLFVVSLDFKRTSLEDRASAIRAEASLLGLLNRLDEKIYLCTCNRVCVFAHAESITGDEFALEWAASVGLEVQTFDVYTGPSAVEYVFKVASSLDSMVLGENQITGQFKRAYEDAVQKNWVSVHLHRLCQQALRVAKRVRSETEIGLLAVSVPSVAVKLAERVVGDLSRRKIGILGAGEMGRLAAEYFASVLPKRLILFNRTTEKAHQLAESLRMDGVRIDVFLDWKEVLQEVDVLVCCADIQVTRKELESAAAHSRAQLRCVLDLTSPPSVERVDDLDILFKRIDDLKRIAEENTNLRSLELGRAHEIVQEEVQSWVGKFAQADFADTIQKLSLKFEDLRQKELGFLKQRLGHLREEDWREVEKMSRRLIDKLIQDPVTALKGRETQEETWLHFFRNIFRI